MRNSLLITLWLAFTTEERKQALAFACQMEDTAEMNTLFALLRKYANNEQTFPSKEQLFIALYGKDKPYNDLAIRKLFSKALGLLEQFIFQKSAIGAQEALALRAFYLQRNLTKHFEHHAQFDAGSLNIDFAPSSLATDWARQTYAAQSLWEKTHNETVWQQVKDNELIDFCTKRLRLHCQWVENQRRYNEPQQDDLLAQMLLQVPVETATANPIYNAWLLCYQLLYNNGGTHEFDALVALLLSPQFETDFLQQRELFQLALNYCSRLYNKGDRSLLDRQLQLFRTSMERDLLYEQGKVNGYTFTNMITIGLINQSFGWVEDMLSEFGQRIVATQRKGILAFNHARLCYARKEYQKALVHLQDAIYDDLLLNLSAKTVQMKTYYALNEWSALGSHIEAMQKFIRRHKELSYHRENFINLLSIVAKLQKSTDRSTRQKIKTEIEQTAALAEKEWLLEVINLI